MKGLAANLPNNTTEGYCYVTTDDRKFYIDLLTSETAALGTNRIVLNADYADRLPGSLQANGGFSYNGHDDKTLPFTGIYSVIGTQTAQTGAWTGQIPVNELYNGLTIAYYLPYAGNGDATLNLTLSGGGTTGAIAVYYTGTNRMSTQYAAGSTIYLTYYGAGAIKVAGTATTAARWTSSDYNTNSTYTAASSVTAVGTTAVVGVASAYARQDHVHNITLATGDENGQVKIAGTNVAVKGLGSNAYTSTAYLPLAGGTMTGAINRYYGSASTDPMITLRSNNQDIYLFNIGHATSATGTISNNYRLLYTGTKNAPENMLQLLTMNTSSQTVNAIQVDEGGTVMINDIKSNHYYYHVDETKKAYTTYDAISESIDFVFM